MKNNSVTFDQKTGIEVDRIIHHAERLGMKVEKSKKGIVTVTSDEAMNWYWLGANIAMPAFTTGLSKHI